MTISRKGIQMNKEEVIKWLQECSDEGSGERMLMEKPSATVP